MKTAVSITPTVASQGDVSAGDCTGSGGCACQQAVPEAQAGPACDCEAATPAEGHAVTCACEPSSADSSAGAQPVAYPIGDLSTRTLRTSSYVIYVDLPRNDREMLLVHGYTGAFDRVSTRVATFVRAKEDRRAPKPLYGEWAADPVIESVPDLPDPYVQVLLARGYLTYLTREEELERFKALADYLHSRRSEPSYVLMPTYDCNLRCFYCFQDHMRTNPDFAHLLQRMSLGMVDRIFEAMPQIDAMHGIAPDSGFARPITLFGGEPLLSANRDLIERILLRAQEGGTQSLNVITNATELGAYKDLLGPGNLSSLQITLDGVPEEHDQRRIYPDGRGSFAAIAENITMALGQDTRINIRLNIDRNNIAQLPRLAKIFIDHGWPEDPRFLAYTAPIHAGNSKTERATTYSSWELDQALDELRSEHPAMEIIRRPDDRLRTRVQSIFDTGDHPGVQSTFCGAHSSMYVIDRFGDMYACWERTGNPKIRIGQIKPDSTVKIDDTNSGMWRSRTVTSNPVCRQCRYALYCGGGCAVLAEGRKGRIDRNFCDGYGFRFRAMVAEAYADHRAGNLAGSSVQELCDT